MKSGNHHLQLSSRVRLANALHSECIDMRTLKIFPGPITSTADKNVI